MTSPYLLLPRRSLLEVEAEIADRRCIHLREFKSIPPAARAGSARDIPAPTKEQIERRKVVALRIRAVQMGIT